MFNLDEHSHRRLNPLTGEWVIVSPHRTKRPWQGQIERPAITVRASFDPECYLCPGNKRAGDNRNPNYTGTFVFDNDFAALQPDIPSGNSNVGDLLISESERGVTRVVCFSPDHSLTLGRMPQGEIAEVVTEWANQYVELGNNPFINYVQIFENRGEMMGSSNPHPHGQIWASETVPNEPSKELYRQAKFAAEKNKCLLCEYLSVELEGRQRVVCDNDFFAAVVPFWAVYPFETMVLSNEHRGSIDEFSHAERAGLADILKRLTTRYDNLFLTPFPYSMGFHQKPTDDAKHDSAHFHGHFYPPLLRSATIRKFLVGFELLGSPQRDITPESAAERLRELSETHQF